MDRNSEPVKFWHVCGPLLLYWVIQFVAQLVAELADDSAYRSGYGL